MISVFDTQPVILEEKDGHVLTVSRNGLLYKDSNGEVLKDVDFEDVNGILPLRYLNSNISYNLIFRGRNWKNMASELDTDRYNTSGGHNIRETKAIITAFARHKLTDDFPDNLDTLDLPLDLKKTTSYSDLNQCDQEGAFIYQKVARAQISEFMKSKKS